MSERFTWAAGDIQASQCVRCKHKHDSGGTCNAFLNRIPVAILMNRHDHREPYPGDNGIRFEPRDNTNEDESD
jgi:hypothetical protein